MNWEVSNGRKWDQKWEAQKLDVIRGGDAMQIVHFEEDGCDSQICGPINWVRNGIEIGLTNREADGVEEGRVGSDKCVAPCDRTVVNTALGIGSVGCEGWWSRVSGSRDENWVQRVGKIGVEGV